MCVYKSVTDSTLYFRGEVVICCLGGLWPRFMASAVARAYSGGMGAVPSVESKAKPLVRRSANGEASLKLKATLNLSEQYCIPYLTILPFEAFRYFIHLGLFVI